MQLKEPQRDPNNSRFVKFEKVGDKFQGRFFAYNDVNGNFGPKKELVLKTADGMKQCDCPTHLRQILDANITQLGGKIVTVTLVGFVPTGKGNPMKKFHVDAADKLADVQPPAGLMPDVGADDNDAAEPDNGDPF